MEKLVILLVVMVIFATLGGVLQSTMNYFDRQNAKRQEEMEAVENAKAGEEQKQENATADK